MSVIRQIARVPLAGWLLGAVVGLGLLAWTMFQRARIYQQRLAVSVELGARRRQHRRATAKILADRALARKASAHKIQIRAKVLALKREQLNRAAGNLPALADHMNRVFGK